jgi:hypothetical protein
LSSLLLSRRLPVFEPTTQLATSFDAAVRANRPGLGSGNRTQSKGLRNAYDAANEGGVDLPQDQEPARRAAPVRTQQAVRYLGIDVDDALEIAEQTEA